jgi:sulfatase maturation enzyme AslB (radical SAM superfamily)
MGKISSLTLVLSDRCNFTCPYCPQRHGKSALSIRDITAFLGIVTPRLARDAWLGFTGGEPLLCWPLLEKTVAHAEKNRAVRFRFALTSNGSLLKTEHILFLKEHRIELVLSYDGLAQAARDAGSVAAVEKALAGLQELYPQGYLIHSVFTPRTVPRLAASIEALMERGHPRLQYALDTCVPWNAADLGALKEQLRRLAAACRVRRRKTGEMPLENFKDDGQRGTFACSAGVDRLALLPDRTVWGCRLFHDLLGHDPAHPDYAKYCLGRLGEFASAPGRALASAARRAGPLRQDFFISEKQELCGLCADLERCAVCPAAAALASRTLGVVPSWTCRIRKIARAAAAAARGG